MSRTFLHRIAALLLLGTLVAACSPDDPYLPAPRSVVAKKGAWLRVIHAADDDVPVLVRVGDSLLFQQPQRYLTFSAAIGNEAKYYPVDTAARGIRFTLTDGTTVASIDTATFAPDAYYTVYLYGRTGSRRTLFTTDSIEPPTDQSQAKLRVVHLANDALAIDVRHGDNTSTPIVSGLQYGSASSYVVRSSAVQFLSIIKSGTDTVIFATVFAIPLAGGVTSTILLTGDARPTGDDLFIQLSTPFESTRNDDSLRGSVGLTFVLGAQRLVNITPSGDSSVDMTYLEKSGIREEFVFNDYFRRTNYSGTPGRVDQIPSLGNPIHRWTRPYRYETQNINKTQEYRIEYHQTWAPQPTSVPGKPGAPTYDYRRQSILAAQNSFQFAANRRYSIVAYGPYSPFSTSASTTVLLDNTTEAPAGMAQVRLFHGAFGAPLESKRLRLRINGVTTPTGVGYGEATAGTNSITVPAGVVTAEVIDESGTVVHTQTLITEPAGNRGLESGQSYTVYLSRGYQGGTIYLHPLSEELDLD